MPRLATFFGAVGRAVLDNGGRALASLVPFGDAAYMIARDAYDNYRRQHGEEQLRAELAALARASPVEVREAAAQVGREAESNTPDVRLALVSYLEHLPTQVEKPTRPVQVPSPRRTYTLGGVLATGDVADVFTATAEGEYYLFKASRIPEGAALLANERRNLESLAGAAGDLTYRAYLPRLIESFPVQDTFARRVNVFAHEQGFYTLEQVHEQYPVLDPRHLAWIFKRLLTVLGFSHRQGVVHGAVLPAHVLLHAGNHGLKLVGWGQSVASGAHVRTLVNRHRDWYPPEVLAHQPALPGTDLYLAAQCVLYLAGGVAGSSRMPATVPGPLARFVESCLLPGVRMRPDDAWELQDELDGVLTRLFGRPRYVQLDMS